jgi:hypothetical protein
MVLPIILDWISADLILSYDKEVGNDLLAHYKPSIIRCCQFVVSGKPSFLSRV